MSKLTDSLVETPVVEKEGYHYFVHPVSDGVPAVDPGLLREIVTRIVQKADLEDVDKIVAPEAMGIHIGTALSLATDIPFVIVRKRGYGLDGEVEISKETGYEQSEMYINDVEAGDRVLVVDDVLSTGGTLRALLTALAAGDVDVVDTVVVLKKVGGDNEIAATEFDVKTLVNVDVVDGEVVIVDETGDG